MSVSYGLSSSLHDLVVTVQFKKRVHNIEEHVGHIFNAHSGSLIRIDCDEEQAIESRYL